MIDEGDDCAYVIGNNVRHSAVDSFRNVKFCIKFLFCYLIISIPIVSGWLLIIYCFASCLVLLYFYSISKVYLSGL